MQLPALTYCTATFTVPANNTVAGGGLVTATVSLAAPPGLATPAPGNGTNGLASGNKPDTVLWLSLSPGAGVADDQLHALQLGDVLSILPVEPVDHTRIVRRRHPLERDGNLRRRSQHDTGRV